MPDDVKKSILSDKIIAIIRNVTESKEQEKQLQIAKIKAEEASRGATS